MNRLFNSVYLVVFSLIISCGASKTEAEIAYDKEQYKVIKNIVNSRDFKFNATASYPMQTAAVSATVNTLMQGTGNTSSRINLSGGADTIVMKPDSVSGRLAYVGELRGGASAYGARNNGGIEFNGKPDSFQIKEKEEKLEIEVTFKISNGTEQFDVKMDVFTNKRCMVQVYGSNRTAIRYEGEILEISSEQ